MRFSLVPFAPTDAIERLDGSFELQGRQITCRWEVTGAIEEIVLPARADEPGRRMSLWEHTCFEFFIGPAGGAGYYEFNLAPSGHWNSFSFTDVRTGMTETEALACTASSLSRPEPRLAVMTAEARFALAAGAGPLAVGVSAVMERASGDRYYYALSHDGGRPDFHRRSNHRLAITAQVSA